jgi:hypothetical protein
MACSHGKASGAGLGEAGAKQGGSAAATKTARTMGTVKLPTSHSTDCPSINARFALPEGMR